jgi:YHS domain-containing protein
MFYYIHMSAKDPVCGMMVDEKKAQYISEVSGKKVYLCSTGCKSQFDQNPGNMDFEVVEVAANLSIFK